MNVRYLITSESLCNSTIALSFSMIPPEEITGVSSRNMPPSSSSSSSCSLMMRMAIRVSRARWYNFIRRVFHYQNGGSITSHNLGPNPFNSLTWMMMESIAFAIQILIIAYTLAVSKGETPIWPMRFWVSGYAFACILSLILLCCRYFVFSDTQHHTNIQGSRSLRVMGKCTSCVELFFAIWFVMGNVWALNNYSSRFGSFHRAPKLHLLCIILLSWNAVTYSFPFILFVLLCCCVPLFSRLLGYNINMGSIHRGASDECLSTLPTWNYKQVGNNNIDSTNYSAFENQHQECCICLASYREKEEIRQLPCSHIFHLNCVDQWLKIISCCPLCKKELEK